MSETRFTPGPWRISKGNMANVIEGPSGRTDLDEWDDGYAPVAMGQPCCSSYKYEDREANMAANLNLIAAAPDLYAALEEIASDYEVYKYNQATGKYDKPTFSREILDKARAALRKARGET